MESNKFKMYYQFVDVYKKDYVSSDEYDDNENVQIYQIFDPIEFGLLIKYIDLIINKIYFQNSKENAKKIIETIKKSPYKYKDKYHYKEINLGSLINADYNFLKNNHLIKANIIKNENDFLQNLKFQKVENIRYPFSLKELYDVLLIRAIDIIFNNYYKYNNINEIY